MKAKSFSIDIIDRLIIALYAESKGLIRTSLARRTNMSYDSCANYLEFLHRFDLILYDNNEKNNLVIKLNKKGHLYYKRNSLFIKF